MITDHGWLLMPGDLPKVELPEHLTEIRKGRCARLKEGSQTDQQVVILALGSRSPNRRCPGHPLLRSWQGV